MPRQIDPQLDRLWEHLQDAQATARQLRGHDDVDTESLQSLCNIIDLCEISKTMRDQVVRQVKRNGATR